ncbi:winged helix-turn-helix domain-containing protein [Glaciecola sp. 33A]|uniref:winged helix-turn-helix domain-containing protein n=1 Tax=Glaciecola sp. 33A TaxID=2057807 RepID=UPI000C328135|nr:winged helix-turn-helix domain-containing protein [Glaciecola sp. 33A]PKI01738.1 transcriptional regulator [Glaciecola sp. 33A]
MTEQVLPENGYFRLGDYYVDVGDHRVFYDDQSRHLEPKAMHVLYQLALCAGETVSRQELMDQVWHGRVVIDDALTRIISQLRLNFNDSKTRQVIQTVPKKGYRLSADITWLSRQEFIKLSTKNSAASGLTFSFNKGKVPVIIMSGSLLALLIFALLPETSLQQGSTPEVLTQDIKKDSTNTETTVAFLPWRNLTGDERNDYLAEMLPEELSITLAKSDRVTVLAHYSALALANETSALNSLVEQLNLEYWVEGSITEANERIRFLVRLVEKQSNNVVWSQVYEDDMQQLLTLNTRIVSDINAQLFGQNTQTNFTNASDSVDINAYRAYLQGNYWWMNGKTSEWFSRAEASFLRATELAPNFAAAYGSLAFIYARYNYHDIYMGKTVAIVKATAAINKALQLDPNDINALLAGALLSIEDLEFDNAQRLIDKVLSVDAANTRGLYVYSELALAKNQFDVALTYADKALQIDALSPWLNVNKAIVHFWRNEMTKALAAVDHAINIDSNYTWAYVWKAKILNQMGQISEAIEAMKTCLQIDDGSPVNSIYLALLYNKAGMPEQADEWFAHTASLYGDSPDARFWQSYLSFIEQEEDPDIVRQLINQVTIKTTRFFSLVPLQNALLSSQPLLIQQALPQLLSLIERPNQLGFWVNYHNQYNAYAALALMQQLDSAEYEQQLELLDTQIKVFERKVVLRLRADLNLKAR